MKPGLPSSGDLRGAARLATSATLGLADLVEAMHARIDPLRRLGPPAASGRTRGLTGVVYNTVRGVTRLVGGSTEALLALLPSALPEPPGGEREALLAALNGVLGDHLAATANPLATPMTLRRDGHVLPLQADALRAAIPDAGPVPLVLVHGLCMNDRQWHRNGHDHGAALARELGCTPVHLHYNTGLPIADNGRAFADLLQALLDAWPQPVERLSILAHSLGGLVARRAVQHAEAAALPWRAQLRDLVFLGTPHHGAPLERAGHGLEMLLGASPYSAPLLKLTRVRSAGITDLRRGLGAEVPLPADVRCIAVAARWGEAKARLLGDGLVPLDSALGRSLGFAPQHQWIAEHTSHMALLSSPEVFAQLRRWLG